jgi:adenosyl cobinamide kinase/adenosyl cobinamide phosphate guanylyltransferase
MRTYSPLEIEEANVEVYPFADEWKSLLGEPDIRFSTLIRGEAKSGKSTYCAKFAQMISQFGRVLYVSAEERIRSKTLQLRVKRCGVVSPKVRFVHTKNIDEIDDMIRTGGYRFVIFDSTQHINMSYERFEALRQKYKRRKLSYHLVMQMGVSIEKWKHEVDVLINVKEGYAYTHGRYGKSDRMQVLDQHKQQQELFQ